MADTAAVLAVVVVLAGVAGAVGAVQAGAGPSGPEAGGADQVENGSEVAPGERMAGVVGAERASVESEVAVRAFDRRVATANSSRAKARVVGGQVANLQERLDELGAERAELERARENGTLSTGEYRARLAHLYAEERALQRLANRTERTARGLPAETLREQGVNVTAIQHLRANARNLTGPEVAAVARNIAGRSVGRPAGAGPPDFDNRTGGPPGEGGPGNGHGAGPSDGETGPPDDEGGPQAGAGDGGSAGDGGPPGETGPANRTGGNETATPDRPGGDGDGGAGDGSGDGDAGDGSGDGGADDGRDGSGDRASAVGQAG